MLKTFHECPRCGSPNVYRSRRRGFIDRLFSIFGFFPYVCEEVACRKRFHKWSRRVVREQSSWES